MADYTAKILKTRKLSTTVAAVQPGVWQARLSTAKSYAVKNKVPVIALWSNGNKCSHCIRFESGLTNSYFTKWMKTSGCVFVYAYYGDKADGTKIKAWCMGSQKFYPILRVYWPTGKVDIKPMGDDLIGTKRGTTAAKKQVAYFKKKLAKFFAKTTATATAAKEAK